MATLRDVMDAVASADGLVHASLYDELAPLYEFERARMRDYDAVADFVATHAPRDARTVGVGACGAGFLLARLAERFEEAVGFDASTRMLELAAGRTDAPLVAADLRTVVAPDYFDVVTILGGSIAHVPASTGAEDTRDGVRVVFESAYESLRPGGVFCCDFMERGALESGAVRVDTFESDRFRVERTVVTTGEAGAAEEAGVADESGAGTNLGPTGRYTFAYEITDTSDGETVRVGTSTTVREFGVPQLLGAALNAGFEDVTLVSPPTHGTGLVARRREA